ncbi:hypothetical protein DBR17_01965 [Sphingomonas sp. HMWF008]|nr:hypothetical protein DBR17_01965 [Sphingomonas sp. HMWF008]
MWCFVAERDVARADRIATKVRRRCDILSKFPHLGRPVLQGRARDLSLTDMQYIIRYRIEDDEVLIVGVRHTKQERA